MFNRKIYMLDYNKKYKANHKEEANSYRKEYVKVNKEKINKRMKKYLEKYYKIHKEELKKYKREYYNIHKEELLAKGKIYHQSLKGREVKRTACRKYEQSSRGRLFRKIRKAKRKLLTKDLTITIIQQVYEDNIKQYGTLTCYLCLQPIPFGQDHLEHKTPLSRGGNNERGNLDVACQKCNWKKRCRTEIEYRTYLTKKEM